MIYTYRLACFDRSGQLAELEEFSLAESAWECFAQERHKHPRVELDMVDSVGIIIQRLAAVGYADDK